MYKTTWGEFWEPGCFGCGGGGEKTPQQILITEWPHQNKCIVCRLWATVSADYSSSDPWRFRVPRGSLTTTTRKLRSVYWLTDFSPSRCAALRCVHRIVLRGGRLGAGLIDRNLQPSSATASGLVNQVRGPDRIPTHWLSDEIRWERFVPDSRTRSAVRKTFNLVATRTLGVNEYGQNFSGSTTGHGRVLPGITIYFDVLTGVMTCIGGLISPRLPSNGWETLLDKLLNPLL